MKPSRQPAYLLAETTLVAFILAYGAACSPVRNPGSKIVPPPTEVSSKILPANCNKYPAEDLRPPNFGPTSVLTYRSGIFANLVPNMTMGISLEILDRLNREPEFGIQLPANGINVSYLFPQSLSASRAEEQAYLTIQQHRQYLLTKFCQEQGITRGEAYLSPISLGDTVLDLARKTPFRPDSEQFNQELSKALTLRYVQTANRAQLRGTAELTAEKEQLVYQKIPFTIRSLPPSYLSQLGLH